MNGRRIMNNEQHTEHNILISDRKYAELSGIEYVESFDENGIVCFSPLGGITIDGEDLKIDNFSIDSGKLSVSGTVNGIYYFSKTREAKSGFFGKLIK